MARLSDDEWKKTWASGAQVRMPGTARPEPVQTSGGSTLPPAAWNRRATDRETPAQVKGAMGSFIIDGAGTILAFDGNMEKLTGWDAFEVVGQQKDLGVYGPPDEAGTRSFVPRPLFLGHLPRTERSQLIRVEMTRKDGTRLDAEVVVTPLGGRGNRIAVEVHRVVLLEVAPPVLAPATDHDPVTGLHRAATFHARVQAQLDQARSLGLPVSVLLVDIDHLDAINGRLGRDAGDAVLRHVGGILAASIRGADFVCRLSSDDFGVLLARTGRGDARHVGGRIRAAIETFNFAEPRPPEELPITASIGVACFPADAESPIELLRRAKDALDEVRRLGRNRVWCYARRPRVALDLPVFFDGPAAHLLGQCRDLSNSGIYVETFDNLPVGMRLGLSFQLPGVPEPVRVVGRVVRRIDTPGSRSGFGLGIEFERYSDEDRWRLESFLHK